MNTNESQLSEKIACWVGAHAGEFADDAIKLIGIRSVSDKNADVKPYGQGCRDVLDCAAGICAGYGFPVRINGYRSCTAVMQGKTDEQIGIFGHLDVVPEGSGWSFPPYEPCVKDGHLTGRGSSDNKGPCVAALYAMRCLNELDIKLKHGVLLFLGAAEETGMDDISHYLEKNPAPKFSFTPDCGYSVCHGEKGILIARFARDIAGGNLAAFHGGQATNIVPDSAEAVITGFSLDEVQNALSGLDNLAARELPDGVAVSSAGVARHAADPDGSVNAIRQLASALSERGLVTGPALEAMRFIASAFEDNWGAGLDVSFDDEISGKTSCIGGLAWMDGTTYHQDINVRYAISADVGELKRRLSDRCGGHGFSLTLFDDNKPCYTPADHPVIQMLDQTVQEFYGERFKPYVMGGGTYARKVPNAVGYGPFAGEEGSPFKGGHQPDEGMSVDILLTAVKIYALALVRLDGMI